MPVAIAVAPAAIAAGAAIYGAHKQSQANRRSYDLQAQSNRDTMAFQREQAAEDKRRYDERQAELKQQWAQYVARRQPYWDAADRLIRRTGRTPRARPTGPTAAFTARFG